MIKPQHLTLRAQLMLARLRWFPLTAGLFSAVALAFGLLVLPALKQDIAVERAKRQQQLVTEFQPAGKGRSSALSASGAPLSAFKQVLLPKSEQNRFLRNLSQLATQAPLLSTHLEFREQAAQAACERLALTIALSANYPRIQDFAFTLMAAYPSLALEKIELHRELSSQDQVQAQLHFVLYMGSVPVTEPGT